MTNLTRAVAKQVGSMEELKEIAQNVCNYGANSGFSGFIYYSDTMKFYHKNKTKILDLVADMAENMGETPVNFVKSFNCLKSSTEEEIAITLYGKPSQHDQTVSNALAWFALEEVCRAIADN